MVLKQCKFLLLHVLLVPLHLYYYFYYNDDMYYVGLLCTLCSIPSPWYPPSTDKVQGLPNTGSPLVLCHWNQNRLTAFVERCNEYTKRGRKRRKKERERGLAKWPCLALDQEQCVHADCLCLAFIHPFLGGWLSLSRSLVVPYIASHSTARSGLLTCTCSSCCKGTTHVPYWQPQVVFLFDPL